MPPKSKPDKPTKATPSTSSTPGTQRTKATDRRGNADELHQGAARGGPVMTTAQGAPLADDQNSLRIGDRGPTALEDFVLREKIFHFDHERIPSASSTPADTARTATLRRSRRSPS